MARVRRPGSTLKLASTWTGPWRIVPADKVHVYGIQNIVTRKVKEVHVIRLRFYADRDPGDDGGFKGGVSPCLQTGRV